VPGDEGRTLVAPAEPAALERVHELLEALWEDAGDVSLEDRLHFETAVTEIAGNIVLHAHDGRPLEFTLDVRAHPDRIEARFRDAGRRADVDLSAARLPDDLAESGRGLALALAAADVLEYRRDGSENCWRVVRARRPG
jgi:serine/threonine-protein kinase RsbW